ncbi:MAG: hypothetical protein H6733_14555 [Alphaproteobacteria bacterium]|nr:hypothetical protein [Alphaproteobacteria bacterium]
MTTTHTVSVTRRPVDAEQLGYFRFGDVAGGVLVTNELGEWHHLDADTFRALLAGGLDADHAEHAALSAKGFLRASVDPDHVASGLKRRKKFVGLGPAVHVLHLADAHGTLSVQTAKDIVDFAMLSTSSALELRFVPGDDAVDLDTLGFLVQYSTEKNRYEGKAITWRLDADPAALDDAAVAWLVDKRFKVRATLTGTSLSEAALARIGALHQAAAAKKRDGWSVDVDVVVDAGNVGQLGAIADYLSGHGIRRFRLRPVLDGDAAVSLDAWAAGYRAALLRVLAWSGPDASVEELTATMATRALTTDAAPDVEIRSPSGFGAGLIVYDTQGHLFPSEHGRLADDAEMWQLGRAGETAYREATTHPTLRALAVASLLECLPTFADHWATPYLGVDPLAEWADTGDVFAKAPTSHHVAAQLAALEAVFEVLVGGDEAAIARLKELVA